ncbi:lanthionine synthetase LanC family protein [Mycolicibacterium sp. S3B2]|uniref:lanthionine synthetase LanC family protein n=1 Tax=Mycolicibacterium sp. S3B2 TaxID=3415120 RepID=UPI003C7E735D
MTTDFHFDNPISAVSFRYGVFRPGPVVYDSSGTAHFAIVAEDGTLHADRRDLAMQPPSGISQIELSAHPAEQCPVSVGDTLAIADEQFLLLARLNMTHRSTTFLATTRTAQTVVVRVDRPGIGVSVDGGEAQQTLSRAYRILQSLNGLGISPIPIGFLKGRWPVLVMEDVRGPTLSDLALNTRRHALTELAKTLHVLHEQGFVHGDVKPDNAVLRDDAVVLIDFELASARETPAAPGGTPGHSAPEKRGAVVAKPEQDIYALAGCLFQLLTDCPPGLLPATVPPIAELLRNEGYAAAAELASRLLAADPEERPSAIQVVSAISREDVWRRVQFRPDHSLSHRDGPLFRWCVTATQEAVEAIDRYESPRSIGSCWRNSHFQRAFDCQGINLGAAGIVIGLLAIDECSGLRHEVRGGRADRGAQWLAAEPPLGSAPGLFAGDAGVALALYVAGSRLEDPGLEHAAQRRMQAAARAASRSDLFAGKAGILWSGLAICEINGADWAYDIVERLADELKSESEESEGMIAWDLAHAGSAGPYLGCAHGATGIAMALGQWGSRYADDDAKSLATDALLRVVNHGQYRDSGRLRMQSMGSATHAPASWCHGVAGWLWAVICSGLDISELEPQIDWAVDVLTDSHAVGTPTFCHGLAGQLETWRLLSSVVGYEDLARAEAEKVISALKILRHCGTRSDPWTSDHPDIVTPDLWIGFLGPAAALSMWADGTSSDALLSPSFLARCASPAERM